MSRRRRLIREILTICKEWSSMDGLEWWVRVARHIFDSALLEGGIGLVEAFV